jgi:hypothetical protein
VNRVIEYVCAQADHQIAEDAASPVMIYLGVAAYCPFGSAGDHDWRATGGRTLSTVREWLGRPGGRLLGLGQRLVPIVIDRTR